ncbi:MAG: hypothetical protein VW146_04220 [Gammaproteobacteria bacterium]
MQILSAFDDFPFHQTSEPILNPATSERNFYERYWFNGFCPEQKIIFGIGFGFYPNRNIMDAHFSISVDGKQHSFHASSRINPQRIPMKIGPLELKVIEPMRTIQFTITKNEQPINCDLTFSARTAPVLEPQSILKQEGRIILNTHRFTQLGKWTGNVSIEGHAINLNEIYGTRDKSWGIRPVGEPEIGAPPSANFEPGVYWCWAPIHFGSFATMFGTFQDRDGNPSQISAHRTTLFPDASFNDENALAEEFSDVSHTVTWEKGTRWSSAAIILGKDRNRAEICIELETIGPKFYCKGIGYQHPEWGHGIWKGEEAFEYEIWDLGSISPEDYTFFHVHQIAKAKLGKDFGFGTLENLAVGRHDPSGFKDLFDVAR